MKIRDHWDAFRIILLTIIVAGSLLSVISIVQIALKLAPLFK